MTFELSGIESAVLSGLRKELQHPDLIPEYARTYQAERQRIAAAASHPVALHPGALRHYEQQVGQLQEVIGNGIKAGANEAAAIIRELIESVTVRRRTNGVEVEIKGRLNALLGEEAFPNGVRAVCGKLVAEERFKQPHTRLPPVVIAFRSR